MVEKPKKPRLPLTSSPKVKKEKKKKKARRRKMEVLTARVPRWTLK